jgi:hypothetical protein
LARSWEIRPIPYPQGLLRLAQYGLLRPLVFQVNGFRALHL